MVGIEDPTIDALVEEVIAAPDRKNLVTRVRALDRVLQWRHWVIPQFHIGADRILYWDMFGRPEVTPIRGFQFDAWWVDSDKASKLEERKKNILTQ